MNWVEYKEKFSKAALHRGYDTQYIDRCIRYAERLYESNVPIIYSSGHLASLVGFEESYLREVAYAQERYYRNFTIPKKNGAERAISEPLPNLKQIQRWILENILYQIKPSPYAKAFVPDRSIKENARFHRQQQMVLSIDIENFFPSISTAEINKFFRKIGYSKKLCYYLTRLCTLDGGLPQGAPTSPALSNLIFRPLDEKIGMYCIGQGIRYTRYADDMTFSGSGFSVGEIIRFTQKTIKTVGLKLNEKKTRLMRPHERQEVTGVVVNEKIQAVRELRRDLRQAIYYIEKFGLENHLGRLNERRANYISHLMGQATFILFLNPHDRDAKKAVEVLLTAKAVD